VNPWAAGLKIDATPSFVAIEIAGQRHHRGHEERPDRRILDFASLDLLPQPFRRTAHHQPRHEDGDDDVEEHPVETGADTAEDHLPEEDVHERHGAAEA
jgi:hypothetical protein